jgi:hypothetical protein
VSFWADVRALREEMTRQVAAGAGSQALRLAIAAQGQPKAQPAAPAPRPPASPRTKVYAATERPSERMSAREYRDMMGLP